MVFNFSGQDPEMVHMIFDNADAQYNFKMAYLFASGGKSLEKQSNISNYDIQKGNIGYVLTLPECADLLMECKGHPEFARPINRVLSGETEEIVLREADKTTIVVVHGGAITIPYLSKKDRIHNPRYQVIDRGVFDDLIRYGIVQGGKKRSVLSYEEMLRQDANCSLPREFAVSYEIDSATPYVSLSEEFSAQDNPLLHMRLAGRKRTEKFLEEVVRCFGNNPSKFVNSSLFHPTFKDLFGYDGESPIGVPVGGIPLVCDTLTNNAGLNPITLIAYGSNDIFSKLNFEEKKPQQLSITEEDILGLFGN